jgi:hypothetical protein
VSNESPGWRRAQAADPMPGNNNVRCPGPGWQRGIPNLSRVDSTLEDAAVPSTSDCLFQVIAAPGAELAVVAEAACLHQARKI